MIEGFFVLKSALFSSLVARSLVQYRFQLTFSSGHGCFICKLSLVTVLCSEREACNSQQRYTTMIPLYLYKMKSGQVETMLLNLLSSVLHSWDLFVEQIGVPSTKVSEIHTANIFTPVLIGFSQACDGVVGSQLPPDI